MKQVISTEKVPIKMWLDDIKVELRPLAVIKG